MQWVGAKSVYICFLLNIWEGGLMEPITQGCAFEPQITKKQILYSQSLVSILWLHTQFWIDSSRLFWTKKMIPLWFFCEIWEKKIRYLQILRCACKKVPNKIYVQNSNFPYCLNYQNIHFHLLLGIVTSGHPRWLSQGCFFRDGHLTYVCSIENF